MNFIDDTSPQQDHTAAQPGSLNFVPADPEVPIASIAEVAPPVETGVETKQENDPIYEAPQQPKQKQAEIPVVEQPVATTPEPKVVDKSGELTKIHRIQNPKDKLTAMADTDEEKFIEEVETAHGHK